MNYSSLSARPSYSDFEKLVFASTAAPLATSVVKYRLTKDGKSKYDRIFRHPFFTLWKQSFPAGPQPDQRTLQLGNMIEMDNCLIPNEDSTLCDIFNDVFERDPKNVFSINEGHPKFEEITIAKGECILFEITADINLLSKKVFQIERAMQLWDSCLPQHPKPKVAGVIVTGAYQDAASLIAKINASSWDSGSAESAPTPLVFSIPLFVIYSPVRNIYSDLSEIKGKLTTIGAGMTALAGTVTTLQGTVTTLEETVTTLQGNVTVKLSALDQNMAALDTKLTDKLNELLARRSLCQLCVIQ